MEQVISVAATQTPLTENEHALPLVVLGVGRNILVAFTKLAPFEHGRVWLPDAGCHNKASATYEQNCRTVFKA